MIARRALATALSLGLLLGATPAGAEDYVLLWGNYYKERSTRVVEPMVRLQKELPYDATLQVSYLVDQITSASGAFTASDEPFQEYRNEVGAALSIKLADAWRPGINVRASYEPDYTSVTVGGTLELSLNQDNTILTALLQHQADDVRWRADPSFNDKLRTTLVGVGGSQVLARDLLVGGSLEAQVLAGYLENPYRVENHPRKRTRYTLAAYAAYRIPVIKTMALVRYRFYTDSWKLASHGVDLELTQVLTPELEAQLILRFYTQDDVYFVTLSDGYLTSDPKLFAFNSETYGLKLRWKMEMLRGGPLDVFASSAIEPSYLYLNQHNRYGWGHTAQLGWCWPF